MAWGLEARVPFLDKAFLEVAMNIDPKEKMFSKGSAQEVDADGRPKMEKVGCYPNRLLCGTWLTLVQYILRKAFDCSPDGKVRLRIPCHMSISSPHFLFHTSLISLGLFSGGRRSNSPTVWDTRGLTGTRLVARCSSTRLARSWLNLAP